MPNGNNIIERAVSGPFATSSSFEDERIEQLWKRSRLLCLTGLAISIIALVVSRLVPSADPTIETALGNYRWATDALLHAMSFLVALGLIYALSGRDGRYLHAIIYGTIAFNLVLVIYNTVAFHPATDPYFGVSLLLFLAAAFVPWRPSYQVALAATAAIWFLLLHALLYAIFPEYPRFWEARGGGEAARNHVIWGVVGIAILGGTSAFVSRTLYSLTKTAHKAKRLGNYLIHDEIGQGGMGQVFFAQHSLMCRPTAVKVMHPGDGDQTTALARFEREIKLSATLTHPNTITIYDVGRTPDRSLYYAMEYLEGLDLQQFVEQFGPVGPERTAYLLRQVCGSLAEAHSRDIIHRDIKPSNIFLTRRGGLYDFVKVLDFGLAKQVNSDDASGITKTGLLFGTPRYLAPETVYGSERVDGRADIYNLGGVAYWMLTGRAPFTAASSLEIIVDHVKTVPTRPSEISEVSIPPELESIVMKCLEKKPEDRFQSAWELEEALCSLRFTQPWSRKKAEEWWDLHGILGEDVHDCECFFDGQVVGDEERSSLITAESSA
jgi:serine/threonine-protein kinase